MASSNRFFSPARPSFEMIDALLVAWLLVEELHIEHIEILRGGQTTWDGRITQELN